MTLFDELDSLHPTRNFSPFRFITHSKNINHNRRKSKLQYDEKKKKNWIPEEKKKGLLTALTVSAILAAHITTANLLLQNAATVNLFSTSLNFAIEFKTPISYNFANICDSIRVRKESWGGRRDILWANERREPQSLLYLEGTRDQGLSWMN